MLTVEFLFVPDDVRVVQFFHYVDLLVDVLLQKGFFLELHLVYDFYGVLRVCGFYIIVVLLLRASMTSPKAPFPIDLMIS